VRYSVPPQESGQLSLRDDNDEQRDIAESVFERNQRRETEINNALQQEYARREAAIKNMYRLRALRLARDTKLANSTT
jgi:hypothetical protein